MKVCSNPDPRSEGDEFYINNILGKKYYLFLKMNWPEKLKTFLKRESQDV